MPRLTHALDGERFERNGRAGRLSYYMAGDGPPLLLVHSINAAASAYEIKPLFDRLRERFVVYAPDLPGFGFSDRSAREYAVRLYVDAIADMRDWILADSPSAVPDVVALSLSSEFVARAATEAPGAFGSLALVTPTGFTRTSDKLREPPGATREMKWLRSVLEFPLWRQGLYGLLVRPPVIRYFLKRTFGSDDFDSGLAAYDDLTTHQPGAENAPYAFLSGKLFSRDIRDVYERLELPVWLPHGTKGDFRDFRGADWARQRANWRVQSYGTGALPHFEQPELFVNAYLDFLRWAHPG